MRPSALLVLFLIAAPVVADPHPPASEESQPATSGGLEVLCRERVDAVHQEIQSAYHSDPARRLPDTYPQIREIEAQCLDASLDPRLRAEAILFVFRLPERRSAEERARLILPIETALEAEAPDSPERLQMLEETASIVFLSGDLNSARRRVADALDLRRRIYGAESPEAVDGMINAGMLRLAESQVRDKTKSLNEAREILEEAVSFSSRVLGPRAPATIRAWVSLAGVLRDLGDAHASERIWKAYGEGDIEVLDPPPLRPANALEEVSNPHE